MNFTFDYSSYQNPLSPLSSSTQRREKEREGERGEQRKMVYLVEVVILFEGREKEERQAERENQLCGHWNIYHIYTLIKSFFKHKSI